MAQVLATNIGSPNGTSTKASVFILSGAGLSNGSTLFIISQNTSRSYTGTPTIDLSNVPTLQFSNENIIAMLLCSPNISIQTRQVRTTGNGIFTLGQYQQRQGNLDLVGVNFLLGNILSEFATSSGPPQVDMGTDMMIRLFLGNNYNLNSNTPPAPLTNITTMYKQIIQSATKVFLSGELGVANVTGGLSQEQLVFRSSLGHVIISAISFALLTTSLVVAQFRKRRDSFTLVEVAAALADSDAPQKFAEIKQRQADAGERRILRLVQSDKGDWIVVLGASTED